MESREDPTSYLEVRAVFYVNFSRHCVALRQSVDALFAVVCENLYRVIIKLAIITQL